MCVAAATIRHTNLDRVYPILMIGASIFPDPPCTCSLPPSLAELMISFPFWLILAFDLAARIPLNRLPRFMVSSLPAALSGLDGILSRLIELKERMAG